MNLHMQLSPRTKRLPRAGSVLIAVLIVVVVLALIAYRFNDMMTAEYRASARAVDVTRTRAAAVSGIHWATDALGNPDTFSNDLGGDPTHAQIPDVTVWTDPQGGQRQSKFRIVCVAAMSQGAYEQRNAMIDEGGKLNINALILQDATGAVLYNALMKLPNMTSDIAANIVDWVDADDTPGSGATAAGDSGIGAEDSYYTGLSRSYHCKNGLLNSIDELLLVKGVTPQLLYGTDQNQNGNLSDDGSGGGTASRGLSDYLTVFGREVAVDSTGQLKVYINGDDPNAIYTALKQSGIGDEMAAYIMAAKLFGMTAVPAATDPAQGGTGTGTTTSTSQTAPQSSDLIAAVEAKLMTTTSSGRAVNSIMDLVRTTVTLPKTSGTGGGGGGGSGGGATSNAYPSPLNDPSKLGDLLPALYDKVATVEAVEMIPRLNVNTAQREVIAGLPGLEDADVDAIMSAQTGQMAGDPATTTAAWLMTQANLSKAKLKAIEKYVTGKSMVYRVQAIGYLTTGGPVSRIEAVIDTNLGSPRILYFRDLGDLDNPRGFPTQTGQ